MKKVLATFFLIFAVQTAWATDIGAAKAQGLVGEANSGYLAAVKKPASADVNALIASVNSKRRAEFQKTAKKTNATLAQVTHRFYELAVQRTKPGNFYQDASGRWKRK